MSNPTIFMGKLPIKGIFPIILKGLDFKWWGQNTDRKNYVVFTYNIPIIIYSVSIIALYAKSIRKKNNTHF